MYSMVWRAWYGIWCGLAGMAWYIVWSGGLRMVYVSVSEVWHSICYCLVGYDMVWLVAHDIVYRMASLGMARYMVILHRRHGMVYGVAWQSLAWYMIWVPGMAWHMVWPGEIWHCIFYRLAGMTWYMV